MTDRDTFNIWRPHPWHGLETGPDPPRIVTAYIEITPFNLVKYEVDKRTGYLRVDRPQRTSSQPPSLYGFIPRTYCGDRVGALSKTAREGDGDPLDICVISERPITQSEVLLNARVVGGIEIIDGGKADDKIVAVLTNDNIWGKIEDIEELPGVLVERLRHYFSTYKIVPGREAEIWEERTYGRAQALTVVTASIEDYAETFG